MAASNNWRLPERGARLHALGRALIVGTLEGAAEGRAACAADDQLAFEAADLALQVGGLRAVVAAAARGRGGRRSSGVQTCRVTHGGTRITCGDVRRGRLEVRSPRVSEATRLKTVLFHTIVLCGLMFCVKQVMKEINQSPQSIWLHCLSDV